MGPKYTFYNTLQHSTIGLLPLTMWSNENISTSAKTSHALFFIQKASFI